MEDSCGTYLFSVYKHAKCDEWEAEKPGTFVNSLSTLFSLAWYCWDRACIVYAIRGICFIDLNFWLHETSLKEIKGTVNTSWWKTRFCNGPFLSDLQIHSFVSSWSHLIGNRSMDRRNKMALESECVQFVEPETERSWIYALEHYLANDELLLVVCGNNHSRTTGKAHRK